MAAYLSMHEGQCVSTFSIAAYDAATGDLGVAVASRFLACGAIVPWAKAGVGAVATQAFANASYGPRALELLERGATPEETAAALTRSDPEAQIRQLGIVDAQGQAHAFTGERTVAWAGHRTGRHYTCQGNMLAGPRVVEGMARAFENSAGFLGERLMEALEGGEAAGGDKRGRQAAGLLVVRHGGGYRGLTDKVVDLRVDDHEQPIPELRRIFGVWREWRKK